jgi:hypothetical protein
VKLRIASLIAGLLLAFSGASLAQNPQSTATLHRVGGMFYSQGYVGWQAYVLSGNAATGSQSIIVAAQGGSGIIVLPDQTAVPLATVFNTNTPISLNDANAETVTPSAVTIGVCPAGNLGVGGSNQCATITATFSNTHGAGALVGTGDAGIMEAVTDAGNQGGGLVYWQVDTGIVTLNTGSVTTTTTTKVPSPYISLGGSGRVTTTITTSTSWAVGVSGATTDFCTAQTTLTAGTTCNVVALTSPTSRGTGAVALTAILFTMGTGAPGAGAVKARVWGYTPVQPAQ